MEDMKDPSYEDYSEALARTSAFFPNVVLYQDGTFGTQEANCSSPDERWVWLRPGGYNGILNTARDAWDLDRPEDVPPAILSDDTEVIDAYLGWADDGLRETFEQGLAEMKRVEIEQAAREWECEQPITTSITTKEDA